MGFSGVLNGVVKGEETGVEDWKGKSVKLANKSITEDEFAALSVDEVVIVEVLKFFADANGCTV